MSHVHDMSEERLGLVAAALEASIAATIITDGRVVVFANRRACALFKCSDPRQLEGRLVSEIVHPDGHETMDLRAQILAGSSITLRRLPVKLVALDGSYFSLVVSGTPVDYDGRRLFMFTAEI